MALRVPLTLCLLLVASSAGVMGSKILGTPYINHWLQVLAVPPATDCADPGDLLVDDSDCKNFYVCQDADTVYPVAQTCPEEFDCFEMNDKKCIVDDDGTKCTDSCAGGGAAGCAKTECDPAATAPEVIPKMDDCTKYILCFPASFATRGQVEIPCSEAGKPYFNGAECVADKAECCNCQPPACAGDKFEVFADPQNCHAYYSCVDLNGDGSTFEIVGPSECPDGGKFDGTACVPDDGCENDCDLGGGGDDTTPAGGEVTTSNSDSPTTESGDTTASGGDTTASGGDTTLGSDTTTAGLTTTDDGCTDPSDFTCPAAGYFAHCDTCVQSYLKCDNTASTPTLGQCSGDLVFNPNPDYPYCVRPENCPFPQ